MSLDDAYVALKSLITARIASWKTRESARRALEKVQHDALIKAALEPVDRELKKQEEEGPPRVA